MERPTLGAYGLTDADVQRLPILRQKREATSSSVFGWSAAVVAAFLVLYQAAVSNSLFVGLITGGVMSVLLGPLGGVIVSAVWDKFNPLDPKAAAYERYERDLGSYQHWAEEQRRLQEAGARRRRLEFWTSLDGPGFEREVAALLRSLGHSVEIKGGAGDEGIDLVVDGNIVAQCKQHGTPVAPAVARELLGAMHHAKAAKGILICPSGFTSGTKDFASKAGLELWDGDTLLAMADGPVGQAAAIYRCLACGTKNRIQGIDRYKRVRCGSCKRPLEVSGRTHVKDERA